VGPVGADGVRGQGRERQAGSGYVMAVGAGGTVTVRRLEEDWERLVTVYAFAEQRFRRLDSPELLPEVAEGVVYIDRVREQRGNEEAAA